MKSDYVDNWDALPLPVQDALELIVARFDEGADLLFDRRLNLSFEAAVKELSVPGVVAVTDGFRLLGRLLQERVTVADAAEGRLLFDDIPLTAYHLPLYTPCVYLSQLVQFMDGQNVRVWRDSTACEIVQILLLMARCIRPDIEHARVAAAALHDMAYLHPACRSLLQGDFSFPNAARIARLADALLGKF